jgi:sugar lactone lactonase YvrE
LRVQNLESTLERYAGVEQTAGLNNGMRLESLFNNPAFLAFDQFLGTLYVSDQANHVIRQVEAGESGQVLTLAGTDQAGMIDGSASEAAFDNPQGLALDNRENLWVVDTANHTIRRINTQTGRVETIAGLAGVAGLEDGTGEEARFNSPVGIAVERESDAQRLERQRLNQSPPPLTMIVTDTGNGVIRRVRDNGEVETIGVPTEGTSGGSNVLGLTVSPLMFTSPTGVVVDPLGNIYVTDPGSGEVKTILSSGEVVSVVQPGTFSSPQGVVITESGKIVVADTDVFAQQIVLGTPQITDLTPRDVSTQGRAVVTIRGRNFTSDSVVVVAGVVITEVSIQDTRTLTLVAPELPSGLTTVTVQNRGGIAQTSLFVEPFPFDQLPVGHITTVAGGTTFTGDGFNATAAFLSTPAGIALDSDGNLFISDEGNSRVRRVDATTGIITTVAGNRLFGPTGDGGLARETALDLPRGIALDRDDNLFISETLGHRIRRVDAATGIITTVAGIRGESGFTEDGALAVEAAIEFPLAVVFDGSGNLLFSDATERIRKVDATTGIITTVVGIGERGLVGDGGLATEAALNNPRGLLVDGDGNMLISDSGNSRVRKVDAPTGIITTVAGTGKVGFSGDGGPATEAAVGTAGIALDSNGNLFIVHALANRIRRVDATTGIITTVAGSGPNGLGTGSFSGDGGPATGATLNAPLAVAVDAEGNLFISDSSNHRIRGVDASTGIITTVAGTGFQGFSGDGSPATEARLLFPDGVVVDGAGNLFLADRRNDRIRRVEATTDIIETVAGTGQEDFSGDGGLAAEANLWEPKGVAVDAEGNLFIADRSNGRIRRVDAATGLITTVAGSGKLGFTGDGGPATEADVVRALGGCHRSSRQSFYHRSWQQAYPRRARNRSPGSFTRDRPRTSRSGCKGAKR